jgi:prevent-host-death family protein
MKRDWQLQDAKNQLSRVVAEAKVRGPQTITVHGRIESWLVPKALLLNFSAARRYTA